MMAPPSAAARGGPPARRRRSAAGGFTLVELLVAVTIGMALTLGITVMLIRHESGRRALTAVNDVSLGGAYISYVLDRTVRSAGSGYTQNWHQSYGCQLTAARGGTQILPRGSAFPAPFASLPQAQRLAPVMVYAGAGSGGSDILSVATGASGLGESGLQVLPNSATGTGLRVPATVGVRALDLVLVIQDGTACLMQQVAAGFSGGADQQLTFGGTYAGSVVNGVRLDAMGTTTTLPA
jgi:type IV pilus assembly protein PilW